MAFDGITIAGVVHELNEKLTGGRIYKIAQPESDELLLTIKQSDGQYRLFISVEGSLPLLYLTETNKPSPLTAPNFCMLLRKHLQNGRIISITQPGFERIVHIGVEHLNEMGDLCCKTLIIEIMGKHSNIIFCDDQNTIIDSIKHISAAVSSVREVLPGKPYFVVQTQDKAELPEADFETFKTLLSSRPQPLYKAFYGSFTGISPILSQEIIYRAGLDGDQSTAAFRSEDYQKLYQESRKLTETVKSGTFSPCIAYTGKNPVEFAAITLTMYTGGNDSLKEFDSISSLLETFYAEKNKLTRIRQICCDPSLLLEDYHGGSAKREACLDLIESAMGGGHRMLLFSQFTSFFVCFRGSISSVRSIWNCWKCWTHCRWLDGKYNRTGRTLSTWS